KTASYQFPIYIKASQEQEALDQQVENDKEDLEQIRSYVKALIDSRRGYIDAPAVLHNLREVFEKDLLDNNQDFILKSIEDAKSGYVSNVGVIMPKSMGKADSRIESENDKLFPLTSDIL